MTTMTAEPANLPARQNSNGGALQYRPLDPISTPGALKALMESQRGSLTTMLPKHITPERLFKTMLVAANRNPDLFECTQSSLLETINRAAELGLDLSGTLGEAYPVPFNNKVKTKNGEVWVKQCQLIIGYRGMEKLAWQSGEVESIDAEVVYLNDKFLFKKGTEVLVEWEPCIRGDRGEVLGAYACVKMKSGGKLARFLTKADIEKIRNKSKSANSPAWRDWWDEMARKCALKRTLKDAPLSTEKLTRAIEHDAEDITDVVEAATSVNPAESRSEALNRRLAERVTQRPVSEEHTLELDADAPANVAAQQADQTEAFKAYEQGRERLPADQASGLRDLAAETGGTPKEESKQPVAIPAPSGASMLKWAAKDENDTAGVHDVLCEAAMSLNVEPAQLDAWLKEPDQVAVVAKIKSNKATPLVCRELVQRFVEGHGGIVS